MDAIYESLKAAVEFEKLAANAKDPHVKAVYSRLAQRYRQLTPEQMQARPRANRSNPDRPSE